jgi:hypothetical protein
MPNPRPDGDAYFVFGSKDASGGFNAWPEHMTPIGSVAQGLAVRGTIRVWIGSNEPASYSLTTASQQSSYTVCQVSGFSLATLWEAVDVNSANQANLTSPDVTTLSDLSLVFRQISVDNVEVTATPATERSKGLTSGTGGVGYGVSSEDGPEPAGSTGTEAWTHASDQAVAITLVIGELEALQDQLKSVESARLGEGTGTQVHTFKDTLAEDDLVIIMRSSNSDISGDTISGYTAIDVPAVSDPGMTIEYKFMGATPDTTVTIPENTNDDQGVVIEVWTGIDTTTPLDVAFQVATGTGTNADPPSITPLADNCIIKVIGAQDNKEARSSPPTNYTNFAIAIAGGAEGTNKSSLWTASRKLATAAAENPGVFGTHDSNPWRAYTIALRPAAAPALDDELISSMHFQRHYEPITMSE